MKIKPGILQCDSLSPLLFVLVMIPLTLVSRQTKTSQEVKKGGKKIYHLLLMDDLKLCEKQRSMFLEDIKMEFGLPKIGVLIM